MSDVVDITPLIARRRRSNCGHRFVEVDDDLPSLTCAQCGCELDPWWFVRRMAHDEETTARQHAEVREAHAKWLTESQEANAKWMAKTRETQERLVKEIAELTETKNRLWNTQVDGRPLGTIRRPRRKA